MMGSARNYRGNDGGPGRTRTCGTRFRKPLLYPPELQARRIILITYGRHLNRFRGHCTRDCSRELLSSLPEVPFAHDVVAVDTLWVLRPVSCIATRSGMPLRIMFLTAVRRKLSGMRSAMRLRSRP